MKSFYPKNNSDVLKNISKKISTDEARLLLDYFFQGPFTYYYKKLLILYVIFLSLLLLWPFSFTFFPKKNHVKWSDGPSGLYFIGEGQVISSSGRKAFYENLISAKGFSLEVWLFPENNNQRGPARIVSYSLDPNYRNFTLGQEGSDLIMRLRTENTSLNGTEPSLIVEDVFKYHKPIHIVVSYNFYEQSVFVDGIIRTTSIIPGGNFKNWGPEYPLILGNEATGDRPWLGEISYLAIYNRSLHAKEVRQNYNEVRDIIAGNFELEAAKEGLLVRYLFNEKKGSIVSSSDNSIVSLNLTIPEKILTKSKPFLSFSLNPLPKWGTGPFHEIVLNVLLFIPLGYLLFATIGNYIDGNLRTTLITMVLGGAITLSAESVQYFIESRDSSSVDVIANCIGTLLGISFKLAYNVFLIRIKQSFWDLTDK